MTVNVANKVASVVMPINSVQNGDVFLVIKPITNGVMIKRSGERGTELNRFWPAWLYDLLLQRMPAKHQLQLDMQSRGVRIQSRVPSKAWLGMVANAAAQIVPLEEAPFKPYAKRGSLNEMRWMVHPYRDLTAIICGLELPGYVAKDYVVSDGYFDIWLRERGVGQRDRAVTKQQARMVVEWKITEAFHEHGAPVVDKNCRVFSWQRKAWGLPNDNLTASPSSVQELHQRLLRKVLVQDAKSARVNPDYL